ncbi:MAG: hypothetical protein ACPGPF_06365 [Pontibacterium sp.]
MNNTEEIKHIRKKISKLRLMELPGLMLFGAGVFALSPKSESTTNPLLQNDLVAYAALALGLATVVLCGIKKYKLINQKSALEKENQ